MSISMKGKANENELVQLLSDLVRINSINPFEGELGTAGGEAEMVRYIASYFDKEGIPYTIQEVLQNRCNLVAHLKGSGEGALVFEAHTDTVTVDAMTISPFDPICKDGKLYGRGSSDDKGCIAAMMHAFAMLKRMEIIPYCDVYFVAAADEEYAYRGVLKFLEDGQTYNGAVIGEATSLKVCVANKGVIRFYITAYGTPFHSSMPWNGHNAIVDMAKLITKMEERIQPRFKEYVHPIIGPRSMSITTIHGGELVNIIPDQCRIQIDVRTLAGDTFESIASEIQLLIDEMKTEDPNVDIQIEEPYLVDSCMETPVSAAIVQRTCEVCDKLIGTHTIDGLFCGCDATKFSRAGTPSIVFGPGDIKAAHTVDEHIEIEQLTKASEIYAQLCIDFRP